MTERRRRVVICDDSRTYAAGLKRFLERDPQIEVVGVFASGEELLSRLPALDPDLVTMDLEMPKMGGERAIAEIMRIRPLPILVLSAFGGKESERAAEALAAGALETMSKTELSLRDPDSIWATALRGRVKRLASVRLRRAPARPPGPRPGPPAAFPARPARAVGIGASTGGPPALLEVLRELPADFQAPVFVVQHIAAGFLRGLVSWLDDRIPLPVRIATAGARVEPGVWFAPDHVHLLLDGSCRMATDAAAHGAHRPSIDVLFRSLAATHAEGVVGVVLTGMGSDGAAGVEAIRAAGGYVVAQDEATSAVFGMPRSAIEAGADAVLPVAEIGRALCALRTEAPR